MNYPSWQQKLREHQAKYDAALDAARKAREADEQAKLKKRLDEFRADLSQIGLDLPESDTGEWEIDGFKLSMQGSRIYTLGFDLWIGIDTAVYIPFDLDELQDMELFDLGYQTNVYRIVEINVRDVLSTAAEIADAFDDLPAEAKQARDKNLRIVLEWLADDEPEGDLSEQEKTSPLAPLHNGEGNNAAPVDGYEALVRELLGYVREIAEAARKLAEVQHG